MVILFLVPEQPDYIQSVRVYQCLLGNERKENKETYGKQDVLLIACQRHTNTSVQQQSPSHVQPLSW